MPHSGGEFDAMAKQIVLALKPKSVLDVGVGAGKFGAIVRTCPSGSAVKLHGIEAEASYKQKFASRWKAYNNIGIGDASKISIDWASERYDLVVFGDVLEHLWRSEAVDLVDFWAARSKVVLAIWPIGYKQDASGDVASEVHRSELRLADFVADRGLDIVRFHIHYRKHPNHAKCLMVIRGWLGNVPQAGVFY